MLCPSSLSTCCTWPPAIRGGQPCSDCHGIGTNFHTVRFGKTSHVSTFHATDSFAHIASKYSLTDLMRFFPTPSSSGNVRRQAETKKNQEREREKKKTILLFSFLPSRSRLTRTLNLMMYLIHLTACAYYAFSDYSGIDTTSYVFDGYGNAYIRCTIGCWFFFYLRAVIHCVQ